MNLYKYIENLIINIISDNKLDFQKLTNYIKNNFAKTV